jgi:hypothetical protein
MEAQCTTLLAGLSWQWLSNEVACIDLDSELNIQERRTTAVLLVV